MARRSGWQQFADNFNAVYDTVTGFAQDVEAGNIMAKYKPKEYQEREDSTIQWKVGDQMYADQGLAKTAQRDAAYADIADMYSRYGKTDEALKYRASIGGLENQKLQNRLLSETLPDLIAKAGLQNQQLTGLVRKQDLDNMVSQATTEADIQRIKALAKIAGFDAQYAGLTLGSRVRTTAANADTAEANAVTAQADAQVAANTIETRIAAAEQALRKGEGAIRAQDLANMLAEATLPSQIARIEALAKSAGVAADVAALTQGAQVRRTEADAVSAEAGAQVDTGLVQPRIDTGVAQAESAQAQAEVDAATVANDIAKAGLETATAAQRVQLGGQQIQAGQLELDAAQRVENVNTFLIDNPEATEDDVREAIRTNLGPVKSAEVLNALDKFGLETIERRGQAIANQFLADMKSPGGVRQAIASYDAIDDGVDVKIEDIQDPETGQRMLRVTRTVGDRTETLAVGSEQEVAASMMQIMKGPMTSMEIAAAELENNKTKSEILKNMATTSYYEAQAKAEGVPTRDHALENYEDNVTSIINGALDLDGNVNVQGVMEAIRVLDQVTGRVIPGLSDAQIMEDVSMLLESGTPENIQRAQALLEKARETATVGGLR